MINIAEPDRPHSKVYLISLTKHLLCTFATSSLVFSVTIVIASICRDHTHSLSQVGFRSFSAAFPAAVAESTVLQQIDAYNKSDAVHGILVQLPLPAHLNQV